MTELLIRPTTPETNRDEVTSPQDVAEYQLDHFVAEASVEATEDSNVESVDPLGTATSRVGRMLQGISNKLENGAGHADAASNYLSDGSERAKAAIQGFGRSALARLKNAGLITVALPVVAVEAGIKGAKRANEAMGDAVMTGFEKLEAGVDAAGNKIVDAKANVKANYQTYQFNRETKTNEKQFEKNSAKELKAFEKEAASERKLQAKVDKWESKFAAKEDRRFERSMRKKAAEERRGERRARWSGRLTAAKEAIVSAPDKMGDALMAGFGKLENGADKVGIAMVNGKEAATDKIERGKASYHTTRAAGRAALEAFKTTRQTHTEQNKLY